MNRLSISFLVALIASAATTTTSAPSPVTTDSPIQRVVVVRLKNQTDMLKGLEDAVAQQKIRNAVIMSGFGSVTSYHVHVVDNTVFPPKNVFMKEAGPFDVTTVGGLIMDGRVHCHITLANSKKMVGGHLEPGNSVFTFIVVSLGVLRDNADMSKYDDWNWR